MGYGIGTGIDAIGVRHTSGKPKSIPIIWVFANMVSLLSPERGYGVSPIVDQPTWICSALIFTRSSAVTSAFSPRRWALPRAA